MTGPYRIPALLALLCPVALGADSAQVEEWIRRQGGSCRRGVEGRIVGVDLRRTWIGDLDLQRLAGLTGLESLALGQTHVTDDALSIVSALPSLRELDLFFCEHITDAGASRLRRAAKLERLNVRGTKISDSGVKFLTELRRLRSLDIGITDISDPAVELLEALPHLESLAIGGNRIGEAGVAGLRALNSLRRLDLSGVQVIDSGIPVVKVTDRNLEEIGALRGLESLNLAAPNEEYAAAAGKRFLGSIRVSDAGADHLRRLTGLRRLNLSRSHLTAAGIERLRPLVRLEELVLAHVKAVDDEAGAALAGFPALRMLDVSGTRFGDAGLAALRDRPALRKLIAAETLLSEEAVALFLAARPGRSVIH